MENMTLRKKLSTYLSEHGRLRNVNDEVLLELLSAWEEWQGNAKDFYRSIGFTHKQMATLLGKAKRLKREGHFGTGEFKEIKMAVDDVSAPSLGGTCIEVVWGDGKIIRFQQVQQVLEFLQKAS